LENKITIFNKQFEFQEEIAWKQDPITNIPWPDRYYSHINFRDGLSIGGIKWVWELNRHHHLVTLGKAFLLSGEERYARKLISDITVWIDRNPRYIGVNWTSALELSIRVVLIWALSFIWDLDAFQDHHRTIILNSIFEQADHIWKNLSQFSSANNHLIGEAAGLAIVGMCFPQSCQSKKWREQGFQILEREIEKQVYPDGVMAEQAIHYLAFILDFNILVWLMAENNSYPVPEIWYERLSAACEFISSIMDESGNVPDIGDRDDGWVVKLDGREDANNYRSILATASVLLGRPDFKSTAREWDESNWLLGEMDAANLRNDCRRLSSCIEIFRWWILCFESPGRNIMF
jgi:hypothetical protein